MQIESNIAPPTKSYKYPFGDMKLNDSFWVEKQPSTMGSSINYAKKRTGWKFLARNETKDGKPGSRIWRVA